jgi:RNA-directed DNA polymerase
MESRVNQKGSMHGLGRGVEKHTHRKTWRCAPRLLHSHRLLANLFLHYAFDMWMGKQLPDLQFERYCDDVVVHCRSEWRAHFVRDATARRLAQCGLEVHPDKTRIVYCKGEYRRATYANERFDFLEYTFRPRLSKSRVGKHFVNFSPAVSDDAIKAMSRELELATQCRSGKSLGDLARMFN